MDNEAADLFFSRFGKKVRCRACAAVAVMLFTTVMGSDVHFPPGEETHHDVVEKVEHKLVFDRLKDQDSHTMHQQLLDKQLADHMSEDEQKEEFYKADFDGNHRVSRSEWLMQMKRGDGDHDPRVDTTRFDDVDRNGDGSISFNEFQIWLHQQWESHKAEFYRSLHHDEL